MIWLKVFYNKSIYKQIIVFTLLFSSVLIFCCLYMSSIKNYQKEKEKEEYRTAIVTFKNDYDTNTLSNNKKIISINKENNEYILIFKESYNVEEFHQSYKNEITVFSTQPFNDNNFHTINVVLKGVLIICIVLIIILIFYFSLNFIYSVEKDVALLKLIGFSDKKIVIILTSLLYLLYSLTYIFSIFVSKVFLIIIDKLKILSNTDFINFSGVLLIYGVASFIIILSFSRIIFKIKKTSPIMLASSV